jgi:hypothetical protein
VCAGVCERGYWDRSLASVAGLMMMVSVAVSVPVIKSG